MLDPEIEWNEAEGGPYATGDGGRRYVAEHASTGHRSHREVQVAGDSTAIGIGSIVIHCHVGPNLSLQRRDRPAPARSWLHLGLRTADREGEVERLVGWTRGGTPGAILRERTMWFWRTRTGTSSVWFKRTPLRNGR